MPNYVTRDARNELANVLGLTLSPNLGANERVIEGNLAGEDCIIVCFPIVHKTSPTDQRFVDLSSCSGRAWDKVIDAWNRAISENKKFFFLAINHVDTELQNHIYSIERSPFDFKNVRVAITREYLNDMANGNISESKRYRLPNSMGYLSIINRTKIMDYIRYFDNRPYMISVATLSGGRIMVEVPEFVEKIAKEQKSVLKFPRNRLLTGAPGTGKSFRFSEDSEEYVELDKKTKLYTEDEVNALANGLPDNLNAIVKPMLENATLFSDIRRITFYPDYLYGNFVGCYKPITGENDEVKYEFVEGPFIELLVKAIMNPYENFCLIIEEINRAKAASVFGDIFQLLDRDGTGKSEYSIKTPVELKEKLISLLNDGKYYGDKWDDFKKNFVENMYIPHNLYIWATMNMADQGVFPMDSAFKRRWEFEFMPIDGDSKLSKKYLSYVVNMPVRMGQLGDYYIQWNNLRKEINGILQGCGLEEDRLIGPYFMKPTYTMELEKVGTVEIEVYPIITKEALVNKLFSYLKQDILRFISADRIFKNNNELTGTMSAIRNSVLIEGLSLQDLFVFTDDAINAIDSVVYNAVETEEPEGDDADDSTTTESTEGEN